MAQSRSKRIKLSDGDEEVRVAPAKRGKWKVMRGVTIDYLQHCITSALAHTLPQVKNPSVRSELSESISAIVRRMREELPKTAAPSSSYRPAPTQLPDIVSGFNDQVLKASEQVKALRAELDQQERLQTEEEEKIALMERQIEEAQEGTRALQGDKAAELDEGAEIVLESMSKPLQPLPESIAPVYDDAAKRVGAVYELLAPAMEFASLVHTMSLCLEP